MDIWDVKNYMLDPMFYRYISETLCNYINSGEIWRATPTLTMPSCPTRRTRRRWMDWSRKRTSSSLTSLETTYEYFMNMQADGELFAVSVLYETGCFCFR